MVGAVGSFVNGALVPMSSIVFRGMVNVLITGQTEYDDGNLNKEKLADGMIFYSWLYFALGLFTFILSFFGVSSHTIIK